MTNYKLLKKGVFEKEKRFEERLNSMELEGWKAISIVIHGGHYEVLMEKSR